jgi:hypothetical protein
MILTFTATVVGLIAWGVITLAGRPFLSREYHNAKKMHKGHYL